MLSNNITTTFSVEESDFLPFSLRSGLNFNAHLMHFLMEDHVTSLNVLCTASTKRLVDKCLLTKSGIDL